MTQRLLGLLIVGSLALPVSGCAGDGQPAPAPAPAPSSAPATPTASATVLATPGQATPSSGGKGATLQLGGTAVLGPLRITVDRVERRTVAATSRVGAHLKACVIKGYDAPAAFTVGAWTGTVDGTKTAPVGDSWDPAVTSEPDEPITGQLVEPGQCLDGFLTFPAGATSTLTALHYRNRQGDTVTWVVR